VTILQFENFPKQNDLVQKKHLGDCWTCKVVIFQQSILSKSSVVGKKSFVNVYKRTFGYHFAAFFQEATHIEFLLNIYAQ
jgi:hypothetical protein